MAAPLIAVMAGDLTALWNGFQWEEGHGREVLARVA